MAVNVLSTGHAALDHRVFDKEARSLAQAGVEVRIFADHPGHERREGVEFVPVPKGRNRLERFLIAPWRTLRAARRRPAPIVHLHDLELLQICPVLRLLGQRVIVYDVHEDYSNMMRRRDWVPPLLRVAVQHGLAAAESLASRWVDGIVGVTQTLADKFPHRRRIAIYNLPSRRFLDDAGYGLRPPSERPFDVIHLGVLSQERLEFLTDVFGRLVARRRGIRLRIVVPLAHQVEWFRSRFAPAVCEVHGRVPYSRVAALMRECKVGLNIHPIIYAHLKVAVPAKVLEYMACGCGVVTSWLPELDRLLADGTKADMTVLRGAGPAGYADAIVEWLDSPGRLDAAGARLRRDMYERYSWETQAGRLPAFYRALLTERGGW